MPNDSPPDASCTSMSPMSGSEAGGKAARQAPVRLPLDRFRSFRRGLCGRCLGFWREYLIGDLLCRPCWQTVDPRNLYDRPRESVPSIFLCSVTCRRDHLGNLVSGARNLILRHPQRGKYGGYLFLNRVYLPHKRLFELRFRHRRNVLRNMLPGCSQGFSDRTNLHGVAPHFIAEGFVRTSHLWDSRDLCSDTPPTPHRKLLDLRGLLYAGNRCRLRGRGRRLGRPRCRLPSTASAASGVAAASAPLQRASLWSPRQPASWCPGLRANP